MSTMSPTVCPEFQDGRGGKGITRSTIPLVLYRCYPHDIGANRNVHDYVEDSSNGAQTTNLLMTPNDKAFANDDLGQNAHPTIQTTHCQWNDGSKSYTNDVNCLTPFEKHLPIHIHDDSTSCKYTSNQGAVKQHNDPRETTLQTESRKRKTLESLTFYLYKKSNIYLKCVY